MIYTIKNTLPFLFIVFWYRVSASKDQLKSLPVFNIGNSRSYSALKHENNDDKVDHMVNILANTKYQTNQYQQPYYHDYDYYQDVMDDYYQNINGINSDFYGYQNKPKVIDPTELTVVPFYRKIYDSVLHTSAKLIADLTDVFQTVHKVASIYQEERQKILSNSTLRKQLNIYANTTLGDHNPDASLTQAITDIILNPASLERIIQVSNESSSEDEVLKALTSVILGGAENGRQSGSALTLDPVTIIALLTLGKLVIVSLMR